MSKRDAENKGAWFIREEIMRHTKANQQKAMTKVELLRLVYGPDRSSAGDKVLYHAVSTQVDRLVEMGELVLIGSKGRGARFCYPALSPEAQIVPQRKAGGIPADLLDVLGLDGEYEVSVHVTVKTVTARRLA